MEDKNTDQNANNATKSELITCPRCMKEKTPDRFYKTGVYCKTCYSIRNRMRYLESIGETDTEEYLTFKEYWTRHKDDRDNKLYETVL